MQKPPSDSYFETQPILMSLEMSQGCTPEQIIKSILMSRMSLEDKLAKFLVSKQLSEGQKNYWVTKMIDLGADVTTRHHVALRWAAEHGLLPLVQLTLQKGADIHCMKDEALARASIGGHAQVVECLIRQGADVNAKDSSALRLSASLGQAEIVRQLLAAGANPTTRNNEAIRKAFDGSHNKVMDLLLSQHAKTILEEAKAQQDTQVFAIVEHYAQSQQDEQLKDLLESYQVKASQFKRAV